MSDKTASEKNQEHISDANQAALGPVQAGTTTSSKNSSASDKSWYSKPESYGNAAGETIQDTLQPVSDTVGTGLETVSKPVGSVVDTVVGGVMRSGEAFGKVAGVGYGNKDGTVEKG